MKYVRTVADEVGGTAPAESHALREATTVQPSPFVPTAPTRPGERSESSSRRRVARSLLEHGPSTVAALAERLGVTPAGVRRHLDALLADGIVQAQPLRTYGARTRGRPPKAFALTDSGRDAFEAAYDDLAVSALQFLEANGGPELVAAFAQRRVAELESRYRALVEVADDPAAALAEALTSDGYAASSRPVAGGGAQLCQHHCPVAHVAEQFPQLCEAETEVFSRLLGTHVQRLATIAHGDGVCTTHIPAGHISGHIPSGHIPAPARTSTPTSTSGRTLS